MIITQLLQNKYKQGNILLLGSYNKVNLSKFKFKNKQWVPVSSTDKVFDGCIRDLGFNSRLYQKLIGVLV